MNTLYHILLDILFKPICLICNVELDKNTKDKQICLACLKKIIPYDTLICSICRNRLPNNKNFCHPKAQYSLAAACNYNNPIIEKLICSLKFHNVRAAAVPIAHIMINYINSLNLNLTNFIIIPVPLHKKRLQERGFNQSEILARKIALSLNLPINTKSLIKIKPTRAQTEVKDKNNREKNLIGCFELTNINLKARNILLIDDVHTTGTTARTISEILKINGAKKIIVLVAART